MSAKIVVVGADFGATGDEAIRVGLQQLADSAAHGLYLVHVLAIEEGSREEPQADLDAHTVSMVAASLTLRASEIAKREHLPFHDALVRVEVRKGEVRQALLEAAREHHASLLIVGTHGRRGIDRLLAGSVAESMVRLAPCSVLVARVGQADHQSAPQSAPCSHRHAPGLPPRQDP